MAAASTNPPTPGQLSRDIIVIGASAGGVNAIKTILAAMPADLPATIFVVIHTSAHGPGALPVVFERVTPLACRFARHGERITRSTVFIAPPDYHLIVRPGTVQLGKGPRENGFRPAVDVLFRSAALSYGPRVIGVILTGNLDDGTAGFLAIKQRGGVTIAQDPDEAMFAGMAQNVIDNWLVDHVARLNGIPALVESLTREVVAAPRSGAPAEMEMEVDVAAGRHAGMQQRIGTPSDYGCPDCGGPLREITDEQGRARFRCHVGHAWSPDSLADIQRRRIEDALWTAIRWLDEEELLATHAAERARKRGGLHAAGLFERRARLAAARSARLRGLLREVEPPSEPDATPEAEGDAAPEPETGSIRRR